MEKRVRLLLQRFPDSGFAWKALGLALLVQGKESLPALQKAAEFLPDDAEAQINLGAALQDRGQFDQAVARYRRALEIKPDYAEAHTNLGNALQDLGHPESAVASYRRALAIKPGYAETHSNLGNVLKVLGLLDQAVASYRRALEIKPDYAEAYSNLGVVLQDIGESDEAVANFNRALEIKPDCIEAHLNLGKALKDLGHLDKAAASFHRALEIKPDYAEVHVYLGNVLQDLGHLDKAAASYHRALEIKPDYAKAHSNVLLLHNYLSDQPAAVTLDEARRFGDLATRQARPHTGWRNAPEAGKCLRVGWVSGDLRAHPVGYFVEGVMAELASSFSGRLELVAYSAHFHADALTARIKACCHGWHSAAGLSDEALARQIRDDGIDILIDLAGHTTHNRLPMFAWKPAPVQITWLGYFATTGVAAIDYLIADPWTLPQSEEVNFTETIWRLPETRLCFTPPKDVIAVAPAPSLRNGHVTFGCFNNLTKINETVVALWARVLRAAPDSRLFLKTKQLQEAPVRQRILELFAAEGITSERLLLEGYAPRADYLTAYDRVDIALDPFPFPGGTTSAESLWMGVPVLTLAGQSFLSRQGVGILMNAGLPDWIAVDADDYVAKALAHASDLSRLATLRSGLRQQVLASPLFDAPRFAGNFEAALRGMWTHWCDQQGTGR